MRTRFLTADYFTPSPSAAAASDLAIELASLPFPSLPVPTLPPDPHLPNPFHFLADLLPDANVAGDDDFKPLPFESALDELLAAAVPQPLPVPDIPAADEGWDDYLYGRGVYGSDFCSTDPVAFRIPKGLDDSRTKGSKEEGFSLEASAVTKRGGLLGGMLEVPEVDFLLVLQKKIALLDDEEADACVTYSFGVPDVKTHLDFIDIDTETRIPYSAELVESIYQVEVPVKHDDDENCPYAKDSYCMETVGLVNDQIIPQLEVSMNSWELDECPAKTVVSNIFHNIVECLYDGAQVRLPSFGSTEFLRSCDMDIFSLVCKDAPRVEYQTDKPITAKDAAEMDFMRINHDILLDKKSALYPLNPDGTCSDFPCSILLEEVETINFPSEDAFKTLVQSVKAEMNTSEEIFKDDFDQAKSFYESVVSSEWALVDDTFKSLATPILPDDKAMRYMLPHIEVLCSLKPLPLPAADGIYLDWHLLSEGPCNQESCSTYASMVEEVKPCSLSSELQISCQQMPALDIGFLEDFPRSAKLQHEDKKNDIYFPGPTPHDPSANLEITQKNMLESDVRGHSHMDKLSPEKESSLFESRSQCNGLSFYLNVRNDTNKVRKNEDISTLDIPSSKQADPLSTRLRVNKLIEIHPVNLSDLIQSLIKDIDVSYTSALQESAYFRHSFSDGQGLSISKQKLLELITGEGSEGLSSYCKYEDKMELIVLYALKQVAYYLCFFGLHAAYLYVGNLTGTFENIPERLRSIQHCIGEARLKAEKQLLESHPSLSVIETILRSNTQIGQKILIVSDRAFWLPLGQKLTAMKITSVEFGTHHSTTYSDQVIKTNSKTCMLEELWKSDCILLDNKNIPPSFPFSEFCMILEYGGPNKSSILLSLAPKLDGLPPFHFLYVTVDGEGLPDALVEDSHTDQDLDAVLHTLQKDLQEKMNKMRIVDSLNFIPATNQQLHLQTNHLTADSSRKFPADVQLHNQGNLVEENIVDSHNFVTAAEQLNRLNQITIANSQNFVPAVEKSSSTSSVSANVIKSLHDNQSAGDLPLSDKIDSTKAGRLPDPEAVIVVNTGNHGKNMLFSRRSSYQQILALERGGMQIVERDFYLPVDLILTAAVCLLWYDTRTSGSNELTISSDTSGITNFVEDIATNILMALSFCFSGCIMVFEGENHLLSAVLEASDSLYVSAASLDMNLQLFFSETPKSTDQIILNCIRNVVRINRAPCPQIPESESLVESFVTAFPSVSPLSAHMILSSGSLLDFLRWSHEQRTQAVEKYCLPPQSVSLFSALCKFGELGESKSVMTDCSSVDSDISSALLQSARKKKRRGAQEFSAAVSHPACSNPNTQLHGNCVENDKVFSPPKLRKFSPIEDMMPGIPEVFMTDQRLDMGSEGVSCQPRKYDRNAVTGIHTIDDDFINELTPNFRTYNERASSMVDPCNYSRQSELGGKQPIRSLFPSSMPSACITSSHPTFPSALEINNNPGNWDVSCGINQTWTDNVQWDFATSSGRNDLGSRYHEPRQEVMQTPASSLSFLKQDFGCHGTSQSSGWEMDYLRQMNENRKARQEQSRCNVSATWSNSRTRGGSSRILSAPPIDSFSYQRNTETPFRDQSPSDIESCRYRRNTNTLLRDQGPSNEAHRYGKGRGGTKSQSHRVRKDFKAQPNLNNGKSIAPSIEPTWTPLDKRARQKLTFATYGNEKQSKLVWRHQGSPGVGCGFPKRYQEEGT